MLPRKLCVLLFLSLLIPCSVVMASLPQSYNSEDKDDPTSNVVEKAGDFVFYEPTALKKIQEQNEKFIQSFPLGGLSESKVPAGVHTKSNYVIKDAYIKLYPVGGVLETSRGYLADDTVKVGYLMDFWIRVPPDDTSGDDRYYYSLKSTTYEIKINGAKQPGKKGVVVLKDADFVNAEANIVAVIHVRHEYDVTYTVNNTTYTETYVEEWDNTYRLTVKDSLRFSVKSGEVHVTYLRDADTGEIREFTLVPTDYTAYVVNEEGKTLIGGLSGVVTYSDVKEAVSKPRGQKISLPEWHYSAVLVPSQGLQDTNLARANMTASAITTPDVPFDNFLPFAKGFYMIESVKVKPYIPPREVKFYDLFGDVLPVKEKTIYLITPQVKYTLDENGQNTYLLKLMITSGTKGFEKNYEGTIYVDAGGEFREVAVKSGVGYLTLDKTHTYVIVHVPSDLPENYADYPDSTSFFKDYSTKFEVGRLIQGGEAIKYLIILTAAALPLIAIYYLLKKIAESNKEHF